MRFGTWRGVTLASALAIAGLLGIGASAPAGVFHRAIPRTALGQDVRTGDVMLAPPVPWGEYAKDYVGTVQNCAGKLCGWVRCGLCGGAGCGACNFQGLMHGQGGGCGHGDAANCDTGACQGHASIGHGGKDCGGHGLFAHADNDCDKGAGHKWLGGLNLGHGGSKCSLAGCGAGHASAQAAPAASAQTTASPQTCGACQGKGCGLCGGKGWNWLHKSKGAGACGNCGGVGCGLCKGGLGGLLHHGGASACGNCGGAGCGLCKGNGNGNVCGKCGGAGCDACRGAGHSQHLSGTVHGVINKVLHKGEIKYFVGPGGPVPLTPGYVPYVVPTRSPRDFFAFPPFSEQVP